MGRAVGFFSDGIAPWDELQADLIKVAKAYQSKYGSPLVLIIDDADYIAKDDSAFFKKLLKFAETQAAANTLRMVFVSYEGSTINLLMDDPTKEHAQVLEVGDLSDEQAVEYLLRRGVPKDRAQDAVTNILGGRILRLGLYCCAYQESKGNKGYREMFDNETSSRLVDAGLPKDHKFFQHLKHGTISRTEAKDLLIDRQLNYLLKWWVLFADLNGTYRFNSRVVETYFRNKNPAA